MELSVTGHWCLQKRIQIFKKLTSYTYSRKLKMTTKISDNLAYNNCNIANFKFYSLTNDILYCKSILGLTNQHF